MIIKYWNVLLLFLAFNPNYLSITYHKYEFDITKEKKKHFFWCVCVCVNKIRTLPVFATIWQLAMSAFHDDTKETHNVSCNHKSIKNNI